MSVHNVYQGRRRNTQNNYNGTENRSPLNFIMVVVQLETQQEHGHENQNPTNESQHMLRSAYYSVYDPTKYHHPHRKKTRLHRKLSICQSKVKENFEYEEAEGNETRFESKFERALQKR